MEPDVGLATGLWAPVPIRINKPLNIPIFRVDLEQLL